VCVIDAMPALEFVALLRQVAQGTHTTDPRVRYVRASVARFTFDRPIKVNTDGEVFEAASCTYTVMPRAARFIVGDAPFTADGASA
jgi:diacylglycerol kinase family enzyme